MDTAEIAEIRRVQLQPGDVVVCRLADHVSRAHIEVVKGLLEDAFPEHKVIVLGRGVKLEVMAAAA